MVTFRMAGILGLVLTAACSGKANAPLPTEPAPPIVDHRQVVLLPPDTVEPGGTGPQYPGTGFRVHEWGTNTIVVGSDGTMPARPPARGGGPCPRSSTTGVARSSRSSST